MNVQSKPAQAAAQASVVARPQGARASSPAGQAPGAQALPPQSPPPQGPAAPRGDADGTGSADMASSLDRLDAYSSSIAERVRAAFEQAAPGDQEALRDAMEMIQGGLDRVRNGIENGTLAAEDIQRGTSKLYEMVAARIAEVDSSVTAMDSGGSGPVQDGKGGDVAEMRSTGGGPGVGGPDAATASEAAVSAVDPPEDATEAAGAPDVATAVPVTPEAGNPFSPQSALLDELSGLGAQLQALLGESLFGGQSGQIYGLGNLPETIAPRSGGLDLSA